MLKDIHYERAILSCICQFGLDAYSEVEYLDSECFSDQANAILFDVCKNIVDGGNKPDVASIMSVSNDMGFGKLFERDEEVGYIRSLFNFPASLSNSGMYGAKLKKLYTINKLMMASELIHADLSNLTGAESIDQIIATAENPISEITDKVFNIENSTPTQLCLGIEDYIYDVMEDPSKYSGLKTGFDAYDEAIGGGLRRGAVDVMGGRSKSGKSSHGLQVAVNLSSRGIPVLIIDTEMMASGQKNRVIANQSMVDVNEITSGEIQKKQEKFKKVIETARRIDKLPLYHINVSGRDFKSILSIMRQWIKKVVGRAPDGKLNDCVIIYDYLKLTTSDDISKNMQEYQALGFQMTELYNFMVKTDCACLAYVQLNREMDVSQSDRIKWLCTSFSKFLLKSPEEMAEDIAAGEKVPYNRKIEVEVCRFGPATEYGNYINVRMHGEFSKLDPGPTRNELYRHFTPPDILTAGEDSYSS